MLQHKNINSNTAFLDNIIHWAKLTSMIGRLVNYAQRGTSYKNIVNKKRRKDCKQSL